MHCMQRCKRWYKTQFSIPICWHVLYIIHNRAHTHTLTQKMQLLLCTTIFFRLYSCFLCELYSYLFCFFLSFCYRCAVLKSLSPHHFGWKKCVIIVDEFNSFHQSDAQRVRVQIRDQIINYASIYYLQIHMHVYTLAAFCPISIFAAAVIVSFASFRKKNTQCTEHSEHSY